MNSTSRQADAPVTIILYDGTTDGYLCALACAFQLSSDSIIQFHTNMPRTGDLFAAAPLKVATESSSAARMYAQLQEKGGRDAARNILFALLAMEPDTEIALLGYARKLLQFGSSVDQWHNQPDVAFVHRSARKVSHEIHRFKGLLRFSKLRDGRFMAIYEPDYDITLFLAWHFSRRLRAQAWIILDAKRACAATWNGQQLNAEMPDQAILIGEPLQQLLQKCEPDPEDGQIQSQWQTFHKAVAIENRTNPQLQRRCMPARYWKHLTEIK